MKLKLMMCSVMIGSSLAYAKLENKSDLYEYSGKSYLFVKPVGQSNSPELISCFRYDREEVKSDGRHGAFQLAPLWTESTNNGRIARYFFPFGKTLLKVKSSTSINNAAVANAPHPQGDILADHFNVFTENGLFESTISLCPKQTVFGFIMHGRKSFWRDDEGDHSFWASLSFPIVHVRNKLNLHETVTVDGGGANPAANNNVVANMKEAFRQSAWKYGKIHCDGLGKTGVADVEIKVGYEWLQFDPAHLETYIGVLVPTGNRARGEYVFEPIVGHGGYFGLMWGSAFGLTFYEDEARDHSIRAEFAMHSQYLFERRQTRSFDVKYKPWSRYMGVYSSLTEATDASTITNITQAANFQTPGINIFTRPVDVTPGFMHDFNGAVVWNCPKYHAEIGWNYYSKQDEEVTLACGFPSDVAFKALAGGGNTSDIRDISGQLELEGPIITLPHYQNAVITEDELDLASASSPAYISHTVYATVGYKCEKHEYPILSALGGSYEFTDNTNAAINRWMIWGKVAVSF